MQEVAKGIPLHGRRALRCAREILDLDDAERDETVKTLDDVLQKSRKF